MTDHPILFNSAMVRAILAGRKTQTRRVLNPQPPKGFDFLLNTTFQENDPLIFWLDDGRSEDLYFNGKAPRIGVGDTLWVRETWSGQHAYRNIKPSDRIDMDMGDGRRAVPGNIWYWAEGSPVYGDWERPRPSIHMPRYASRISLRVTDVRVELVSDITEDDAIAEGIEKSDYPGGWKHYNGVDVGSSWVMNPKVSFQSLWQTINGPRGLGWAENPWVAAYTFERIE